jgi:periplasmic copper chaperone A
MAVRKIVTAALIVFAACFATITAAQNDQPQIKDVWTRATAGKTTVAAVFMTISSPTPDLLVSASTPIANKTDLMTMEGDSSKMGMRYVKDIPIPAKKPVSLNPMGLHVWLDGLKQPLKAGETFPLTLNFEKAGQREVTVMVTKANARGPERESGTGSGKAMQGMPGMR